MRASLALPRPPQLRLVVLRRKTAATVAGSRPVHEASFGFGAAALLSSDWDVFRKTFKVRQSGRLMRDPSGPSWKRIGGRGFTLWVSEIRLTDSTTVPPTWEIRLQSLATLNAKGQQCWAEVCKGIEGSIRAAWLERVDAIPSTRFRDADAEPGATADGGVRSISGRS